MTIVSLPKYVNLFQGFLVLFIFSLCPGFFIFFDNGCFVVIVCDYLLDNLMLGSFDIII